MANPKHLEIARQGKDAWNTWRKENPDEPADFSGADFTLPKNKDIWFARFEFGDGANFKGAKFGDWTSFREATFGNGACFARAIFPGTANFYGVTFGAGANFAEAGMGGKISFRGSTFKGEADFAGVRLREQADFSGATGIENLILIDTQASFKRGVFRWTADPAVVTALRRLRGAAKEGLATDAERDLFILERMAERGVLWKAWWDRRALEPFGWWRPLAATTLIFFYWALSNCGRSVALPILWFVAANAGAYYVYSSLADTPVDEALRNLTFANLLPFGTLAKPLAEHAAAELFHGGVLPPGVGLAAIGQGVVNALLVFLLALALRNHFKVK